jgi:hypothetical protein
MDETVRLELLKAEYIKLQEIVESFDAKALQFKGWSVTVTLAGAVGALVADGISNEQRLLVLLLASFGSLAFWGSEAMWKTFQQAFYTRLRAIEDAMAKGTQITPFAISTSWHDSFHANKERVFWKTLIWPHTAMPHAAVTVFCLGLAVWLQQNPLSAAG